MAIVVEERRRAKGWRWAGLVVLFAAGLEVCGGLSVSGAPSPVRLSADSRLWLRGDSTLHPYSSTATKMDASGWYTGPSTGSGPEIAAALAAGALKDFSFSVSVTDLSSGERLLDKKMRASLKAAAHPEIVFRMTDYQFPPWTGENQVVPVKARGLLSVAGTEKPVELDGDLRVESRRLRISGRKELLMTDFGVKPPVMFFGALKTDNRVVVHYEIALELE
ncbi:MAG TPA: YceI family protein [Elusimicrobiota bacterium]|nr:YceI family protein [Elusimicrobiota bacterium]